MLYNSAYENTQWPEQLKQATLERRTDSIQEYLATRRDIKNIYQ